MNIEHKARGIKLLVLDVDGVLTDGRIIYGDSGEMFKCYNVKDEHGIKLLRRAGIEAAIITGRRAPAVRHHAQDVGITTVFQRALNKVQAYEEIVKLYALADEQVCVCGDDLPDLPVMRRAGLSCAVPDSAPEVISEADYVTEKSAGNGAVREVCELLLKSQGLWEKVLQRYYEP